MYKREEDFKRVALIERDSYALSCSNMTFWGEWCGKGIHSGAVDAVCQMEDKQFFVFAIEIDGRMHTDLSPFVFLLATLGMNKVKVLAKKECIFDPMANIKPVVDKINSEVEAQEEVDQFMLQEFNLEGPGEGLVGVPYPVCDVDTYFQYAFKAKTEAHRVRKGKNAAQAREPLPQDVLEFCATYVTEPRLKQAVSETDSVLDMSCTKAIIDWMMADIVKEGSDDILEMGCEWKKMSGFVSKKVVQGWKELVNEKQRRSSTV
jgi:hypothetical protein